MSFIQTQSTFSQAQIEQASDFSSGQTKVKTAITLGILMVAGGIFVSLAALQILPHGVNALSQLGAGVSGGAALLFALGGAGLIYGAVKFRSSQSQEGIEALLISTLQNLSEDAPVCLKVTTKNQNVHYIRCTGFDASSERLFGEAHNKCEITINTSEIQSIGFIKNVTDRSVCSIFLTDACWTEVFGFHTSETLFFTDRKNGDRPSCSRVGEREMTPWYDTTAAHLNLLALASYIPFLKVALNYFPKIPDYLTDRQGRFKQLNRLPREGGFPAMERLKKFETVMKVRNSVEYFGFGAIFLPADILITLGRFLAYELSGKPASPYYPDQSKTS